MAASAVVGWLALLAIVAIAPGPLVVAGDAEVLGPGGRSLTPNADVVSLSLTELILGALAAMAVGAILLASVAYVRDRSKQRAAKDHRPMVPGLDGGDQFEAEEAPSPRHASTNSGLASPPLMAMNVLGFLLLLALVLMQTMRIMQLSMDVQALSKALTSSNHRLSQVNRLVGRSNAANVHAPETEMNNATVVSYVTLAETLRGHAASLGNQIVQLQNWKPPPPPAPTCPTPPSPPPALPAPILTVCLRACPQAPFTAFIMTVTEKRENATRANLARIFPPGFLNVVTRRPISVHDPRVGTEADSLTERKHRSVRLSYFGILDTIAQDVSLSDDTWFFIFEDDANFVNVPFYAQGEGRPFDYAGSLLQLMTDPEVRQDGFFYLGMVDGRLAPERPAIQHSHGIRSIRGNGVGLHASAWTKRRARTMQADIEKMEKEGRLRYKEWHPDRRVQDVLWYEKREFVMVWGASIIGEPLMHVGLPQIGFAYQDRLANPSAIDNPNILPGHSSAAG